jgi:hypothetical protein
MADRIDRTLTLLWAALGAGVILKPAGYVGWQDLALWAGLAWLATMFGLYYLRLSAAGGRA